MREFYVTTKLYYENPELQQVNGTVIQSNKDERGYFALLDKTCFYPEGGGQPADTGFINNVKVLDVQMVGEEIRHYTEQPLPIGSFSGEIDWERRWDHMQQHAGQHVLSAIFDDCFGMKTSSFHLGTERVSIDLDSDNISKEQWLDAEKKANEVIQQHIPIRTEWVANEKVPALKLRKPPAVDGPIRIVTIDGVDINACGGTHPLNSADISLIKLISTEKSKGGTRIYFLCGKRAIHYFQQLLETTDELVRQLNAPLIKLTDAATALIQEKAANEKITKDLRDKLLETEAAALTPNTENGTIEKVFEDRSIKEVQQLARLAIANHPNAALLFLTIHNEEVRFVCAKGVEAKGDMRGSLKELLAMTNGKGGGNEQFGQGGGTSTASAETLFRAFQKSIENFQ
ncbi:alanine--tRNA ligase-related protein [Planococcus sp. N028]|uniref:Alanine--tRNA ligase-related protein n=1 Tax=Planococcus shixiaomingii TaxID=3058393 RepID=A0ABT8N1X2_9BACL|nr:MULTISPECIES: alanine--tRNA ligase-related protein [unclassified Planococcus (in: firmicutes)]MDN7241891.1 alanine--tRNA ligase-related protein [Planococcus sp. N028]WKA54176.1 alanine--tRNA ligase-related protein [Planococcus sp. N022]